MDDIQQKIEEFKQNLKSQSPLKETILTCPAVLPAVGLIAGLVMQYYFHLPLVVPFVVLTFSVIFYFFNRFLDFGPLRAFARNDSRIFISVFLCFLCLGSIRLINYNKPAPNDIRKIAGDDFTFAHIKAQIISAPIIVDNNDWVFAEFFPSGPYTTFYAKVSDIKTTGGWTKATGTIKFYISEPVKDVNTGYKIEAFCKLDKFSAAENPGQFDTAEYMNSNGVFLSASVKTSKAITILDTGNLKSPYDIKGKIQNLAIVALNGDTEPDNNTRLVEAMLLGSRTKIDKKLYDDFIKTGLVHLVVLSGMNVGILAGVVWWLTKRVGLLHIGRSTACIIATIIFLLAVPSQSSTLRAGIMFFIFCLARMFNGRASLLNSIAVSAIFLLLIRPMDFLNAGFQLSFGATIGIVLFCPLFFNFLISLFGGLNKNYIQSFFKAIIAAFSTGCTAWLFVAPTTAWHFYQVQLLTAFWTVPAMIPATIIIVLGTFKILLNPLLPTLAAGLAYIIDFSAWGLSELVTLFAKVPFSQIIVGKQPIYIVLAFYLVLFLWKFFPFIKKTVLNYLYPAVITLLLISAVFINKTGKANKLILTVLSVGHGQAAYIRTPDNKNFIIDAGSITNRNIGDNIVNPFLNYTAEDKINTVFISHDDIDHYDGLPEILDKHKCKNIYTTSKFLQDAATSKTDARLCEFIRSKNIPFSVAPEKICFGNTAITRLWPNETADENSLTDNESALVLLIEYAGRKILFCSDITADVQGKLMNLYPQLDIDLMITPHHGSGRTTDPNFLTAFKPEYFITSCSEARLTSISPAIKEKSQSYYTCKDGAVTVSINSAGQIRLSTFK
ncbi:MAG: ComEC/Rec2 family competence protein [Sedimentisphaerales bacterium]